MHSFWKVPFQQGGVCYVFHVGNTSGREKKGGDVIGQKRKINVVNKLTCSFLQLIHFKFS